ncbi:AraC family transcriptional regulator [Azospirillum sp. HJ39]|uniref:helix-turn-helix transcriptional regulator n=1 Tax=Azospirillum sp. HJ39 TaxID=3159496 RepID=UPI00355902F7
MSDTIGTPTHYSSDDHHAMAERFGYRYRRLSVAGLDRGSGNSCALLTGSIGVDVLQPGLTLTRSDIIHLHDFEAEAEMKPGLLVSVVLDGPVEGWVEGCGDIATRAGTALNLYIDSPLLFTGKQARGVHYSTVAAFARQDWLEENEVAHMRPPRGGPARLHHWIPSAALKARLHTMDRRTPVPALDRLHREMVTLELMTEALRPMAATPAAASPLRPADLARMVRVRDRLLAEPDADHTLAKLACDAGVSVTVLKERFRAAFGRSVFDTLRDIRLDRARSLIEGGWSVSQAAAYVGYRHPSNFTTAFRRRFGHAPGTIRR